MPDGSKEEPSSYVKVRIDHVVDVAVDDDDVDVVVVCATVAVVDACVISTLWCSNL